MDSEHRVTDELQLVYEYPFESNATNPGTVWYADMLALFQSLRYRASTSTTSSLSCQLDTSIRIILKKRNSFEYALKILRK